MKHVVHCSGYSLAERRSISNVTNWKAEPIKGKFHDWEHVCFGDPRAGILGRIPMSLRVAEIFGAEYFIWSTGSTRVNGSSEAEIMMQCALAYLERENLPTDKLRRISAIDDESINTATSMEIAARLIRERYSDEVITLHLVTSANHAPRLVREALIAFPQDQNVMMSIVPAHTSYGYKKPSDVIIRDL